MNTGRGLLIWVALSAFLVLALPTPNSAFAVQDQALWSLTGTLDTTGQVKAGDNISYTYLLKNTGPTTKHIGTPVLMYTPAQFRTSGFNIGANFECSNEGVIDSGNGVTEFGYMIGREKIYCAPTGDSQVETQIILNPGQSFSFQVLGTAISNYTIASKSYSFVAYGTTQKQYEDMQSGINIWETSPSDAVSSASYPYGEYLAQVEASRNAQQNNSTATKPKVLGQTQDLNRGVAGGTDTGSAANAQAIGDPSQNEIAATNKTKPADTRNPNLKNPNSNDDVSWADLLAENQKLIATASGIMVALLVVGTILTRRVRAKRRVQREYKKAVTKLRNSKRETKLTFAPEKRDQSHKKQAIKRTQIVADTVELDQTVDL